MLWFRRAALLMLAVLLLPTTLHATPGSPGEAVSAAAAPTTAAAATAAATPVSTTTLRVFNRDIFTFRAVALGMSTQERVARSEERIGQILGEPGPMVVTLKTNPLGTIVQIDDRLMYFITAQDVDPLLQETEEDAAERSAAALRLAIDASRESRQLSLVLRAVGVSVAATALALGLLWLMRRVKRALEGVLMRFSQLHLQGLRISGIELFRRERMAWAVQSLLKTLNVLLSLLVVYTWIGVVLAQFPYTRIWGINLSKFLFNIAAEIGSGIVGAVPGLLTAIVIFFITRFLARLLDNFFTRLSGNMESVAWLAPDVVRPTWRIAKVLLWVFALAMAYPYLPGARTEAFKGLSVMLGLMLSIGASNLVGQAGSGLILTYARIFRQGEYVKVAEHEGTVVDLGVFVTRIRTGMGEEVSLSNSVVLGAVTTNYSRAVKGPGFVVDTTVTIGYDTPWRQVEAMLIEAARRTTGVLHDPAPQVFQVALADFYPEYRLVCQAIPSEPMPRARVMSMLHANVQDVFNEHGVQIMSPHYLGDPAQAKLVPKANWFAAPAQDLDGATAVRSPANPPS